jgi:hypothetical protein
MSAPIAVQWNALCNRLGVQPKQFGFLLAATSLTVAALAAKTVFKPAKASASSSLRAEAAAPTNAPALVAATRQRVELVLESRPQRDAVIANSPAPAGLHLRAIIAGEFAVIGEETVAVGDEVTDNDGHRFVVEEIQERRVVLREGGRRAELGYASTGRMSEKSAKGVRK